jgi:oligopeptide/dipeptide ABC transporter ATP-binding protein
LTLPSALLDVRDLHVHFPTATGLARAVNGISFSLAERQTFCLVGESGCGKSATALALLHLHGEKTIVTGTVHFNGVSVYDLPEPALRALRGPGLAMIFQEPSASLNPIYSLGSQVRESVRLHRRLARRSARQAALDLLRAVQLADPERVARQYPHEVSGGMQQRVAIALALAGQPRLLIADEPTSALDITVQMEILTLLQSLKQSFGMALLFITHDLNIVSDLADTVAVMYAGKIVETGPVRQVFAHPLHPYTAALLACRPRLGQTTRLTSIDGTVPRADHPFTGCRFQPRCAYLTPQCQAEPGLVSHGPHHQAACWHPVASQER